MPEFRELRLTSPHMKGPDVRKAQKALNHNRFGDFYDGKIDGVYGPMTAGAVKEAKFKLGYPKHAIDQHYDERLDGALNKRHDISPLMKRRRARRKRERDHGKQVKLRALELALRDEGVNESPPNSNRCKFTAWYGFVGPWCLMAVSKWESDAGSRIFERGHRYAYNPTLTAAAQQGDYGMRLVRKPEKGDLVQYQFDADAMSDHIGIFIEWINSSTLRAVEGNTTVSSSGDQANGGIVAIRTRSKSLVSHFIRLPE